jgi:hypothetical protein
MLFCWFGGVLFTHFLIKFKLPTTEKFNLKLFKFCVCVLKNKQTNKGATRYLYLIESKRKGAQELRDSMSTHTHRHRRRCCRLWVGNINTRDAVVQEVMQLVYFSFLFSCLLLHRERRRRTHIFIHLCGFLFEVVGCMVWNKKIQISI